MGQAGFERSASGRRQNAGFDRSLIAPSLCTGVTAYIVLTVLVLQHPVFSNHPVVVQGDVFLGFSLSALFNVLTFLALAIVYAWRRIVPRGLWYGRLLFLGLGLGVVGEYVSGVMPQTLVPVAVAADMLTGVTLAAIGVEQVRLFAAVSSRQGAINLVVVMFLSCALLLIAGLLNASIMTVFCLVLAGACYLASCGAGRLFKGSSQAVASPRYGAQTSIHVPRKLLVTIALQGLSAGIIQGGFAFGARGGFFVAEGWAFACAGALATVFFLWLRRDFNHLLYVIGFPIMALGHLGLGLVGATIGVVLIHETGYRFIMFLSWMLAAWVIKHRELSPNWVWPCIMCAFVAGRFVGIPFGSAVGALFGGESAVAAQMITVFVLLFSALLLFGSANLSDGWGMTSVATEGELDKEAGLRIALAALAKEHGLTPRETEVSMLLAKGRDQAFVAETLHISVDTVKTHRRSIYRKLDIHSHQELLSLIERTEGDMESEVLG